MLDTDERRAGTPARGTDPASVAMPAEEWKHLFAAIAEGEAGALERLYEAVSAQLYGLAVCRTRNREDAADVLAETFVRVAQQGERLRNIRDPRAWLLTVARRLTVDVARQRARHAGETVESAAYLAAPGDEPGRAIDARRAARLLAELPERQREAVYLRHFADCTFAAIGRIVGVPTFTAASRYRLGLRRLRALLEETP